MGLIDWFRRPAPIATLGELDDFVDSHTAFLVQKVIYEYARARSGTNSDKLFREAAFIAAIDASRWQNYPICLAHMAQMLDAALRPLAPGEALAICDGLVAMTARIAGRYDTPPDLPADFWPEALTGIEARLRTGSLAQPHPVKDIAKQDYQRFFDQLPIHASLRGHDFSMVRNNLRFNLCRAHETFLKRADLTALLAGLTDGHIVPGEKVAGPVAG